MTGLEFEILQSKQAPTTTNHNETLNYLTGAKTGAQPETLNKKAYKVVDGLDF
jgi:hypothetical protein